MSGGSGSVREGDARDASVLGAVICGGRSSRYGRPKALARVGGRRLIDRVVDAVAAVVADVVLIANDSGLAAESGLPWRADRIAGLGALGGIHAALCWARELGRAGALAVACDMPFLEPALLAQLVETALRDAHGPDVVIPESEGRRGIEPLCAFYATSCLPAIERGIEEGDRRVIGFHASLRVERLAFADVRRLGDPERMFFNVNTTEDRELAELIIAASMGAPPSG